MTQALSAARMIRTTNGTIAFANLAAQIDGLELHAVQGSADQPFMGRAGRSPNHAPTCSAESPTMSALLR